MSLMLSFLLKAEDVFNVEFSAESRRLPFNHLFLVVDVIDQMHYAVTTGLMQIVILSIFTQPIKDINHACSSTFQRELVTGF